MQIPTMLGEKRNVAFSDRLDKALVMVQHCHTTLTSSSAPIPRAGGVFNPVSCYIYQQ